MRRIPSRFLRGRVRLDPYLGTTGDGSAAYGSGATVPTRVEGRRRRIKAADGSDIISTVTCIVQPDTTDHTQSRATIVRGPAHLQGQVFTVAEVGSAEGLTDTALVELLLDGPH